ncbi:MAG: hypothetical protein BroJett021_39160 [Chloroflexota bacterium]|nr:hypothetical protein [Caldilinea sp.]GIK74928.1 MAG: hypothetical protein BroJett021_39160 [Chloroflexota bacterium]
MSSAVLRRVVVHDRYQLELKLGYPLRKGQATRYRIDTYLFAPHSLGINPTSYPQSEFYRDIQHYVRMKTPSFTLAELLDSATSPLARSEALMRNRQDGLTPDVEESLRNSLRILRAVLKSAVQNHLTPLAIAPAPMTIETEEYFIDLVASAIESVDQIERRYRALYEQLIAANASPELLRAFRLTDESISILIEDLLLRVHQLAHAWLSPPLLVKWQMTLVARIRAEIDYRTAQGYPSVLRKATRENYMRRVSALKKFTSSVLWLSTNTRREGTTLEHILFAGVAGVSMVFATLVAFYAQAAYGEFTMPVFVALVVGYMFKDRIKETGKSLSSHLLNQRLYDYRTFIETQDGRRQLGYVREKVNYLPLSAVPEEVMAARKAGPHDDLSFAGIETTLLYAKSVILRKDAFDHMTRDGMEVTAINDIMRFDLRPFLRKMDEPYEQRLMLKGQQVRSVRCHRTYQLNLVSVFTGEDGAVTCERTLITLDREGIQRIEQFNAAGEPEPPHRPRLMLQAADFTEGE